MFRTRNLRALAAGIELEEGFSIEITVPTQMKSEAEYKSAKSLRDSSENMLTAFVLVPLVLQVFLSSCMDMVWGLFNMLQLIANEK